jgi:hypothetical protein
MIFGLSKWVNAVLERHMLATKELGSSVVIYRVGA